MAVDYDKELEEARKLTAEDIALAVAKALEAQRNLEKGSDWDQKHCSHHDKMDELLPFIDDLISYIQVVKQREERRQKIYEKVTGSLVLSGILAAAGYIGKLILQGSGS